jgi:hypothetical protein
MLIEFPDLPGWRFNVEEVSFGVYRVFGRDEAGRCIAKSGTNPDALLEECRMDARDMGPHRTPGTI